MGAARPLNEIKADLFKGLAHPVRIRVLELLAEVDERPVSDLLDHTGLEASHLSQHLRVLRGYGLVASRRRANSVLYRLAHASVAELLAAARIVLTDVVEAHEEAHVDAHAPARLEETAR